MTVLMVSTEQQDDRLDRALGWYYDAAATGMVVDRADLYERYPDLVTNLAAFFADDRRLDRLTDSVRPSTIPGKETAVSLLLANQDHVIKRRAPDSVGELITLGTTRGERAERLGDYELLEVLGKGGMGVVYRARQLSTNRIVALKTIIAGRDAAPDDLERFAVEAEATALLDHPNIVPIYEVGEARGRRFFSMKLIEDGNLAGYLMHTRRNEKTLARVVARAARAVHHAHQRGVLHRDLKPGNVLLDREGTPYVTDFGLARRVEDDSRLTRSGAILGTPAYMAPEQARCEKQLTTAADVYGLGAVLYECLTGRPPFKENNPLDTILAVMNTEPAAPRILFPGIDRDLETICLKCLHKEPARRYDSAAAMADELERWLAGQPILARPVGWIERAGRWCRRNRLTAGLLGLVGVLATGLILGLGVFSLLLWRESDAKEKALQVAREQREKASAREQMARDALDEVAKAATGWLNNDSGLHKVRWKVLANTLRVYEELLESNPTSPQLRHRTAQAHLRVVQASQDMPATEQQQHLARAAELWDGLMKEDPTQPFYRSSRAEIYRSLAQFETDEEKRLSMHRKDGELIQKLVEDFPNNLAWRDLAAYQLFTQGEILHGYGRHEEAERSFRAGLATAIDLTRRPNSRGSFLKHVATNAWGLGKLLVQTDRRPEGIQFLRQAVEVQTKLPPILLKEYGENYTAKWDLAQMRTSLATALMREWKDADAGEQLRLAQEALRDEVERSTHTMPAVLLGIVLRLQSEWHFHAGRSTEASRCADEYLRMKIPGESCQRAWTASTGVGAATRLPAEAVALAREQTRIGDSAHARLVLGAALLRAGETGNAVLEIERSLREEDRPLTRLMLARARRQAGDPEDAHKQFQLAVQRADTVPWQRDDPEWRRLRAETAELLGLPAPAKK